jgi:glycosyltransferase involved in cell wall biosynthesis
MKILQISDGYGRIGSELSGPVERVIFEVSRHLVLLGHDVTILERKKLGQGDFDELFGVDIVRVDKHRANRDVLFNLNSLTGLPMLFADGLMFAFSINNYIKHSQKSFDIIHFHLPLSGIPFFLLSPQWRSRIVYTVHADEMRLGLSKHSRLPNMFRLFHPDVFLVKHAARCVVLNPELRRKMINSYKLDSSRVFAVHNAIDADFFVSSLKNYKQTDAFDFLGKKIVLFVGLIIPRKGVEYLIRAASILVNDYHLHNTLFILVGRKTQQDKMYFQRVKRLVEQHTLDECVKFIDRLDKETLAFLYNSCNVFVLPSLEEGFGLVITEVLSFGKPVVGTNVGGIPLQIVDGWNGFLVKPTNHLQLAEKLKYLLTNEDECLRMGKNGRVLVDQKFTWKTVAVEYEKVYLSLK